jgi:phosphate:Na+ symporter
VQVLGGVGLFLLGLIVMTDGLRGLAGNAIRSALIRFTRTPLSGAITGAISTAVLQSSTATTVAVVGFVAAGLMNFPSALGIIFGANVGTTITGWLVATLGFKFKFAEVALPLVLLGAVMRLFANGRMANSGFAIAGFGLIFVAIGTMQQGMSGLEGFVTPTSFPDATLYGTVALAAIGMLITVVTQSSSAGVAAALTALYAGVINFEQAAALVVGMGIGTTISAALATLGRSAATRRTGFSHVIFNCLVGVGALLLIHPYILTWEAISPGALTANAEIALVAFHTSFNALGVIIILPMAGRFASLMEHIVPGRAPIYTHKLDRNLLQDPALALKAVMPTIYAELEALLRHITAILGEPGKGERTDLAELQTALDETQAFVDDIRISDSDVVDWEQLLAVIHILDHMQRLHERCEEEEDRADTARTRQEFQAEREALVVAIGDVIDNIDAQNWIDAAHAARQAELKIKEQEEVLRAVVMKEIASDHIALHAGTNMLEAIRWLSRVSNHIGRITDHLNQSVIATGK